MGERERKQRKEKKKQDKNNEEQKRNREISHPPFFSSFCFPSFSFSFCFLVNFFLLKVFGSLIPIELRNGLISVEAVARVLKEYPVDLHPVLHGVLTSFEVKKTKNFFLISKKKERQKQKKHRRENRKENETREKNRTNVLFFFNYFF